ncbi:sensor histidine kinase [Fervidibacillus halotolerans]|uniref:histidine kinase n=1 Tax=Fervidibacillus halotolerans TaxID=2980027 RepID=A0A9E8RXF6_9BACI|nr:sensor histidine kinase [Fervidibacillus halotolerans]WAA12720.1 sensor histidine kinase [Fervidibacillus halotolerans]
MIKHFFIERRSWILFIFFLEMIFLFIAYLDPLISFSSALYIFFLSIISFSLFLIFRYNKETKFYKNMQGDSPFEKIVQNQMTELRKQLLDEISNMRTELEEEKDELMAWVHEVKIPLSTMRLLIDRIEDEKVKNQIYYEWLRVHLLLDQQLHYKRIRFIENDLIMEKIEFKPLIYKEIKDLQSWCIHKGIGFTIDLKVKEVVTDGKWLAFIIRQLLTNAVKYSSDADIEIESFQENGKTVLQIKDYGRGIKQKDLPRIFEKGFTSSDNQSSSPATGMGLYLAKKVAEPLKLEIDVSSEFGKGTTVRLIFPKKNEMIRMTGV